MANAIEIIKGFTHPAVELLKMPVRGLMDP
jgi:hypothetical protein